MRERLADALQRMDCGGQATWLDLADAALSELATPTEGMVEMGNNKAEEYLIGFDVSDTFTAMISAAREGK